MIGMRISALTARKPLPPTTRGPKSQSQAVRLGKTGAQLPTPGLVCGVACAL
jgi:hypothetical protein